MFSGCFRSRPRLPRATSPRRRRRVTGGEVDGVSRQLARYVARMTDLYIPNLEAKMIYRLDRFGRGGHHRPFNDAGFPGVRIMETHENYRRQHQDIRVEDGIEYGDVIEGVNFDYAAKLTGVNVITLAGLAWAPAAPGERRHCRGGPGVRRPVVGSGAVGESCGLPRLLARYHRAPVDGFEVRGGRDGVHVREPGDRQLSVRGGVGGHGRERERRGVSDVTAVAPPNGNGSLRLAPPRGAGPTWRSAFQAVPALLPPQRTAVSLRCRVAVPV